MDYYSFEQFTKTGRARVLDSRFEVGDVYVGAIMCKTITPASDMMYNLHHATVDGP